MSFPKNSLFIALFILLSLHTNNLLGMNATKALPQRETKADFCADQEIVTSLPQTTSAPSKRRAEQIILSADILPQLSFFAQEIALGGESLPTEAEKKDRERERRERLMALVDENPADAEFTISPEAEAEWAKLEEQYKDVNAAAAAEWESLGDGQQIAEQQTVNDQDNEDVPDFPDFESLEAAVAADQAFADGKKRADAEKKLREEQKKKQSDEKSYRNTVLKETDKAIDKILPLDILNLIGDYLDFQKYQPTHKIQESPSRWLYRYLLKINSIIQLTNGDLVTPSNNKSIKIWRNRTWQHVRTLIGHQDGVNSVIQLTNGNLASCSYDNTIKIWDPNTGACLHTLIGHAWVWLKDARGEPYRIARLQVIELSDGNLASCSLDGTIRIWHPTAGLWLRVLRDHKDYVNSIIELPNGNLASCSHDNTIKIWDLATGQCIQTLIGHGGILRAGWVYSVILLANGNLASCSRDKTVKTWHPSCWSYLKELSGHGSWSVRAQINKVIELTGGRLASCSDDSTIKIWDIESEKCLYTFSHGGPLAYGGILANGEVTWITELRDGRLASSSCDGTIKIWNLTTGTLEQTLEGHKGAVRKVIELTDGKLASCADNGTIMIWEPTVALDANRSIEDIQGPAYYKQHPKKAAGLGAGVLGTVYLGFKFLQKKYRGY